jgi:hypothetical protein
MSESPTTRLSLLVRLRDAASDFDEQSLQFGLKVERGGSRNGLRAKLLHEPADP